MSTGINNINWKGKSLTYDIIQIETIFNGLCHAILPQNVSLEPGDRYIISIHSNISQREDQIGKISLKFSSKESYLSTVWVGMPGVETVDFNLDLKKYADIVIFYNEVQNEYIKNCDGNLENNVFKNFAQKFVDRHDDYNCTNVCAPLWLEPITNTIEHSLENCEMAEDYYCMYTDQVVDIVTPLAPESLKSCKVKSPKIKEIKGDLDGVSLLVLQ